LELVVLLLEVQVEAQSFLLLHPLVVVAVTVVRVVQALVVKVLPAVLAILHQQVPLKEIPEVTPVLVADIFILIKVVQAEVALVLLGKELVEDEMVVMVQQVRLQVVQ
jgi:hypothetical protein